jgi:hypothetical protein
MDKTTTYCKLNEFLDFEVNLLIQHIIVPSREDILTHATDFYKTLYSSTPNNILQPQNYRPPADDETEDIPPTLQSEVRSTTAKTKYGKCPGEDGIHNE